MTSKILKDHKLIAVDIPGFPYIFEGQTLDEATEYIKSIIIERGLIDATFQFNYDQLYLQGHVPLTEYEIEQRKQKAKRDKESKQAMKAKVIATEKEKLKELAAKYPDMVKEL